MRRENNTNIVQCIKILLFDAFKNLSIKLINRFQFTSGGLNSQLLNYKQRLKLNNKKDLEVLKASPKTEWDRENSQKELWKLAMRFTLLRTSRNANK